MDQTTNDATGKGKETGGATPAAPAQQQSGGLRLYKGKKVKPHAGPFPTVEEAQAAKPSDDRMRLYKVTWPGEPAAYV